MNATATAMEQGGMRFRRCGTSGLRLPVLSLGGWQNLGDEADPATASAMIHRAFDLGICHFDLANVYGTPQGSAEVRLGGILRSMRGHREEMVIATKAGFPMWAGPFGDGGSRKHLLASLDRSLARLGLDHVDIFYHHRPDPETPIEETMGALDQAVRSGKALYAGISNYQPEAAAGAIRALRDLGTPCLVHQVNYSMLKRTVERGALDLLGGEGVGAIAFGALGQGVLAGRYADGIPTGSRASRSGFLPPASLTPGLMATVRGLQEVADGRGQTLAQLAISWVLRDKRICSALVGASSVAQIEENARAAGAPPITSKEAVAIDAILAASTP